MCLFIVLLLGLTQLLFAQPPEVLWTRTFAADSNAMLSMADTTSDGGFITAGRLISANDEQFSWLVRLTASGDTLWTRSYVESMATLRAVADGGFFMAGSRWNFNNPLDTLDACIVRFNASGDSLWSHVYPAPYSNYVSDILELPDGTILLAGITTENQGSDIWLAHVDQDGEPIWSRTYGSQDADEVRSLLQTGEAEFVCFGVRGPTSPFVINPFVMGFDLDGDSLWTRVYGGPDAYMWPNAVIATADSGYLIAGSQFENVWDSWIIKLSPLWNEEWGWASGFIDNDGIAKVIQNADGSYTAVGSMSCDVGPRCCWFAQFDANGDSLWSSTIGQQNWYLPLDVLPLADNGFLLVGSLQDSALVVRTGPVLPTGQLPARGAIEDFELSQNYPNPFNATTTISFDLPRESHVLLNIFDLTGRSVATLANETLPSGSHHVNFDAANLASGIYVYRLNANGTSQSRKLVLLK